MRIEIFPITKEFWTKTKELIEAKVDSLGKSRSEMVIFLLSFF